MNDFELTVPDLYFQSKLFRNFPGYSKKKIEKYGVGFHREIQDPPLIRCIHALHEDTSMALPNIEVVISSKGTVKCKVVKVACN